MKQPELNRCFGGFWQALLCGFGQLLFMPHTVAGALALLGIALNSLTAAVLGLLGGAVSTATGFLVGKRHDVLQGLYGFNGILLGLAVALFMEQHPLLWGLVVLGAALTAVLFAAGLKRGWPVLTVPYIGITLLIYHLLPVLSEPDSGFGWHLPDLPLLSGLGTGIGQMGFQGSLLTACCMLVALALAGGVRALFWALSGTVISMAVALVTGIHAEATVSGIYGYNAVLAAVALGCTPGSARFVWLPWLGIFIASGLSLLALAWLPFPMLTAPFVVAMWVAFALQRLLARKQLLERAESLQ